MTHPPRPAQGVSAFGRCVRAVVAGLAVVTGGAAASLASPSSAATAATSSSPGLVNAILQLQVHQALAKSSSNLKSVQTPTRLPVIVNATRNVAAGVKAHGGSIEANFRGRVIAATVPAGQVAALARIPGVKEVYPSQPIHPLLDKSVPEIRANQAWALTAPSGLPVQGGHVLVGLVDSGIDYSNPDFKNPDGTTRIKYIWDQTVRGNAPSGFTYGYECDSTSINDGTCPERDTDGHGTHVAGIAAGNGLSSTPATEIGVAPQADIIAVKVDLNAGTDRALAAWQYLLAKAKQLNEPIAINNSFGMTMTPHDGSSPLALAADQMVGPGHVLVAAAGNEANAGLHASGTVAQGQTANVGLRLNGDDSSVEFGFFYRASDSVSLTLKNTQTGETIGPIAPGGEIDNKASRSGNVDVSLINDKYNSSYRVIFGQIESTRNSGVGGQYQMQLTGKKISDTGRFDAWLNEDDAGSFTNPDESDTVDTPADSREVIAVGEYATRTTWTDVRGATHNACEAFDCPKGSLSVGEIAPFSSTGPTADGRQKPDISAPGTMIESSLSSDAAICGRSSSSDCLPSQLISQDGKHLFLTGTSMSSPHVTGVAALMLQVNPTLDQNSITSILRSTARHDQFTGTAAWNPVYGAGKVDALAAVQAAEAALHTSTPSLGPGALSFSLSRIQIQAQDKANATATKTVRAGGQVYLYIYWQLKSNASGVQPTYTYTVSTGGKVVKRGSVKGTIVATGSHYIRFPLKLTKPATYTVKGNVALASVTHQKTIYIKVVKA